MSSTNKQPTGSAPTNPTDPINPANTQNNIVPRDVRLLHLIFATQGIQNYQDHVPLQLMDFAHSKFQFFHLFYSTNMNINTSRIHYICLERCSYI